MHDEREISSLNSSACPQGSYRSSAKPNVNLPSWRYVIPQLWTWSLWDLVGKVGTQVLASSVNTDVLEPDKEALFASSTLDLYAVSL